MTLLFQGLWARLLDWFLDLWTRLRSRSRTVPVVANLREFIARSSSIPADQDRAEVRLYASLITAGFALSLVEPMFYLVAVQQAMIFRVASVAPSMWCVFAAFGLCLCATLPHLCVLIFRPQHLSRQWPRRFAAYATFGSAVTWIYLANLAYPMDVGGLEWAYALRALGSIFVGLTYGFSVNAQQGRDALNASHD